MIFVSIVVWFFITVVVLLLATAGLQMVLDGFNCDNVAVILPITLTLVLLWTLGFGTGLEEIKLYFGKG